jgi:rRNA maturation protein Nop10
MKLKKCSSCKKYTLKDSCSKCNIKTSEAHYKFRDRFLKNVKEES